MVVGLGLNVSLGRAMREFILAGGNQPADLIDLAPEGQPLAREALVAAILEHNVAVLRDFARDGFAGMLREFEAADALRGRPVRVLGGSATATVTAGVARGVDADGALLVERDGRIHRIVAGEVSVRADQES